MPTYEFRCAAGHATDRFFPKISDAPGEIECPTCGERAPRQVSGGAGLLFKGSGFYITDYARKPHKEEGAKEPAPKSESSDKTAAKSETKPADAKPAAEKPSAGKTRPGSDKSSDK
jgi:putative FmdB family regulatory protein